jgi:hypothetical protein
MRHHASILTHLKNSVRHLDALEMTKAFQTINFASLLALGRAVSLGGMRVIRIEDLIGSDPRRSS